MHHAGALPDLHVLAAGLLLDVIPQVLIGQEQNRLVFWDGIDHLDRVARGAENITLGLHLDRRVDVADNHMVRMHPAVGAYGLHRTAFHQAATRLAVRHDYNAVRIEDLGRFGHEPYAAESDDVAIKFARLPRQLQAVAHPIGKLLD